MRMVKDSPRPIRLDPFEELRRRYYWLFVYAKHTFTCDDPCRLTRPRHQICYPTNVHLRDSLLSPSRFHLIS